MEERKEYRIGELYNVQNGLSKGGEFFGTGYPFVSFKTVFNNYFLPVSILDLAETSEVDRIKYSVKRGDILITRTSETAEELGMSGKNGVDCYSINGHAVTVLTRQS